MNAGGVPNTCKSNGVLKECDFGQMTFVTIVSISAIDLG